MPALQYLGLGVVAAGSIAWLLYEFRRNVDEYRAQRREFGAEIPLPDWLRRSRYQDVKDRPVAWRPVTGSAQHRLPRPSLAQPRLPLFADRRMPPASANTSRTPTPIRRSRTKSASTMPRAG